jgi:formylglycine-generating enzyme required for sulfatase activity
LVLRTLKATQEENAAAIENSTQTILQGLEDATTVLADKIDVSLTLSRLRETRFDKIRIAFLKTISDLVDDATSDHLKRASSAVWQWLNASDTFDQCSQILRRGFQFTVENELRSTESRFGIRIADYLCNAEVDHPVATLFACTVLRMERPDDKIVPEYLWRRLAIEEVHRHFFADYLHRLHEYLKGESGFAEVIVFANQVNALGQIKAYSERLQNQFERVDRTKQWLGRETRARQLGREFTFGLDEYVRYLREVQLPSSPLAFVAPRAGLPSEVHIKEIYEPISVRASTDGKAARLAMRSTSGREGGLGGRKGVDVSSAKRQNEKGGDADNPHVGSIISGAGSLVILGPPGIGKSTLMRRIALALAEASPADIPGWSEQNLAIPIFIRLKGFAEFLHKRQGEFIDPCHGSLVSYLDHFYRVQARIDLPPRFFDVLLEFGRCTCILDGFDEVGTSQREAIAGHLTEFMQYYRHEPAQGAHTERLERENPPANVFVMTSREKGFEAAEVAFRPARFSIAHVTPLTPDGIDRLLKRLLTYLDRGDEEQVNRDFDKLSRDILKRGDLTSLAGIPLFCTSMVLVYEHLGKDLPPEKFDILEELVKLSLGYWDILDNKGRTHWYEEEAEAEVNVVVNKKRKRLSHIAYNMQNREDRTRIEFKDLVQVLADYLRQREEGPSEEYFKGAAERFIRQSHDRSNLLVETESTETSSIYEFIHEAFREFFSADWVATLRGQEFQHLIRRHIDDPAWESVLLLAASHARTRASDDTCHDIIDTCLDLAAQSAQQRDTMVRTRRLSMAARMARGFLSALTNSDKRKLRETIVEAMSDLETPVPQRLEIATQLSMLGWLEGDIYSLVSVHLSDGRQVFVGCALVVNQLYERFVNADDYNDAQFWQTPYCTSLDGRPIDVAKTSLQCLNVLRGNNRFPGEWTDPQFGIDNRVAPVVAVNWYEANAYCTWLLRHWNDLPEGRCNPKIAPQRIRLPREDEWGEVVFGRLGPRTFPWNQAPPTGPVVASEVDGRANIGKLLNRTTPVGMFPHGRSLPSGLLDSLGNAWEWQANWFDYSYRGITLRGGAYSTPLAHLNANMRGVLDPGKRDRDVGFRILVECASP